MLQNKDLDLPTQQELLAQFRCDEIAAGALLAFTEAVSAFRKPIDGGKVLETLGKLMADHRTAALAAFDTSASRYHSGVYQRKRAELMAQMNATLSTLFVSQLTNLQKSIIKRFRQNMLESLKTEGYDFGSLVQEEQKKAERDFLLQASSEIYITLPSNQFLTYSIHVQASGSKTQTGRTMKRIANSSRTLHPLQICCAQKKPRRWLW